MAGSVVTLTELRGPSLAPGRSLELRGPALPFQGAAWEFEHRVPTRFPAGNSEGVQHLLGPRELPSDWEGMWRLTQLIGTPAVWTDGAPRQISHPADLRALVEELALDGALLRVVWAEGDRQILRVGRISRAKFPHDRMTDIRWELTFEWVGRGRRQASVVGRQDSNEAMKKTLELQTQMVVAKIELDKLASVLSTAPGSANVLTRGEQGARAQAPLDVVAGFKQSAQLIVSKVIQVGQLVGKVGTLPIALENMLFDLAINTVAQFTQLSDALTSIPYELQANADAKVAALLRATGYASAVQVQADAALDAAIALLLGLRTARTGLGGPAKGLKSRTPATADMLAVHVVKQGETFIGICLHYYGSPDPAADLATANGFPGSQISPPAGTPLIIPNFAALKQNSV